MLSTPWKINMEHVLMEAWKIIFLSKWVTFTFQPLIFRGVVEEWSLQERHNSRVAVAGLRGTSNKNGVFRRCSEMMLLGCPWKLVTILSKLGCNLLRGLTTYLYRGYNLFTKYHGHPSTQSTQISSKQIEPLYIHLWNQRIIGCTPIPTWAPYGKSLYKPYSVYEHGL